MQIRRAPIVDRKLRFALVGCGRIAHNHIDALRRHAGDAELVAVCDTDPAALSAAVQATGAQGFGSLTALLAGSQPDCVVLATPSGLHPQQVIEIAARRRHAMTEKPMATRWSDGLAMVRACDEAGVRLFVVKQNRRNRTLQLLKQAIGLGRFGRIYMVNVNVFWTRPQAYYDSADWRGTWEFDGGAFMNQASHYVDLLDWLIGPVESVMAYTGTLARNIEVEDTGVAALNGATAPWARSTSPCSPGRRTWKARSPSSARRARVRVGGVAVNEIEHWEFAGRRPEDAQLDDGQLPDHLGLRLRPPAVLRSVIRSLRGDARPRPTAARA